MRIDDYVRVVKQGWGLVLAGLVVGVGAALVANVLLPREYTSHLTLYVSGQAAGNDAVAAAQVAQSRILSYRQLLTEDRVLNDVVGRLGLVETPTELAKQIVVSNEPETLLLDVAVTDRSPDQAAIIANAVADSFVRVATDLETCSASAVPVACDKPMGTSFPVVTAQVLMRAQPTTIPVSPTPRLNLALGAFVGLVFGVGAAFAHNALRRRRVRSAQDLEELLKVPTLATFSADRAVKARPLLGAGESDLPRLEAFQRFARSLRLIDVANLPEVVMLTSPRPSAGTTTTTCNLAIALAAEGRKVALVDGNLRRPGIAKLIDIDPAVGLSTVLTGGVPLSEAIQSWGSGLSLNVLPAGVLPPNPAKFLGSEQMSVVVEQLRERYDVVLMDSPSLLEHEDAGMLAVKVDGVLLVCRSGRTGSSDAVAATDLLDAAGANMLGTVLTFAPARRSLLGSASWSSRPPVPEKPPQVLAATNAFNTAVEPTPKQILGGHYGRPEGA